MGWGSHLGSCPGSCLVRVRFMSGVRVRVRVWARVRVRVRVRVWFVFVSGFGIGSEFASYLFYIWVVLDIFAYDIFISYIKYLDSKISRYLAY